MANPNRYDAMRYNRCGRSGLQLPALSLGLWQNFGETGSRTNMREICRTAFDLGITHFDLANNYGPRPARPKPPSARSSPKISLIIATSC